MYSRLFQVTLVVLLVVVSVAVLAVVGGVVMSLLTTTTVSGISAGSGGFSFNVIAVTTKQLGLMIVAASLIIAGYYLYTRRNRFRR